MEDDLFKAALAGLLHDLGVFGGWAGAGAAEIGQKIVPDQWRDALPASAGGGAGQPALARIVAEASRLAAGGQVAPAATGPGQLLSIFCDIRAPDGRGGQVEPPADHYLLPMPLRLEAEPADSPIFPQVGPADPETLSRHYRQLWRDFSQQAAGLRAVHAGAGADQAGYLNSLLKLMQRYCWAVPASLYPGRPNVSLYDHSRMTAALAVCLAAAAGPEAGTALLVGGDISGVQAFIYTITSRGATGGLRGRSMYLQLLTDIVARYTLDSLGLPLTNLIYAGGGHFYLLTPPGSQAALLNIQQSVSRILLHHHQGDLHLALASISLQAGEFQGPALAQRWRALTQELQQAKQRQFAELDAETLRALFRAREHGGNEEKFCIVCQREHPHMGQADEGEAAKCPACLSYEALGNDLRQAAYLCLDQRKPAGLVEAKGSGEWAQVLSHFGYRAKFCARPADLPPLDASVIRRTLLALDDQHLAGLQPAARQVIGLQVLVNVTPLLSRAEHEELVEQGDKDVPPANSVKPFEIMARQARGIKRLGILRMDVDSLGLILSQGLGRQATLSRVASLSFALSLFFEGWVEGIARRLNQTAGRDLVYSIYSGGDDLFFVGAWHLMPLLAEQISRDLSRYAAGHAGIHVSGGIALASPKYPLYQAADEAHEAERAAKTEPYNGQTKNALNFLGKTIPWSKFGEVKAHQDRLIALVEPAGDQKPVSRNLTHRLSQLYVEYEQNIAAQAARGQESRSYWGRGQWYSAYSFTRLARRHAQARAEIEAIRDQLSLENFSNIEWIGPAARWAELLIRKEPPSH
jgi:CRISPR-associated protein Csm1